MIIDRREDIDIIKDSFIFKYRTVYVKGNRGGPIVVELRVRDTKKGSLVLSGNYYEVPLGALVTELDRHGLRDTYTDIAEAEEGFEFLMLNRLLNNYREILEVREEGTFLEKLRLIVKFLFTR